MTVLPHARRLTLGRAWDDVEALIPDISERCPALEATVPAGDLRRFEPLVSGIVLVARAADPRAAIHQLCGLRDVGRILQQSAEQLTVTYRDAQIRVWMATRDDFGSALFSATGSPEHVNGVLGGSRLEPMQSEEDVYQRSGLPFIAPELRNATGEIGAAQEGRLPDLVTRDDIRGDLHMHTTYSDGTDELEDMVLACGALGYEYIAITDHSEGAAAARTLSRSDISRQREAIDRVRDRVPAMTILHGTEVDILPDGRLDFSDDILEQFDIVLASLHESAGQSGPRLTRRCIDALRHPLVNVLTHPMNRLVGRRDGYDLDYEAVYAAAVETGTALEVDGAPGHLDLDGEHARAAMTAGVTLTIDSDCHRAQALERQMRFGLGTARRGWIGPGSVLNTRPIEAVRSFVAAKRVRALG